MGRASNIFYVEDIVIDYVISFSKFLSGSAGAKRFLAKSQDQVGSTHSVDCWGVWGPEITKS